MGAKYDQLDLDERIEMSRLYEAAGFTDQVQHLICESSQPVDAANQHWLRATKTYGATQTKGSLSCRGILRVSQHLMVLTTMSSSAPEAA